MSETTLGALLAQTGGSIKTGPFGTVLKAAEYSANGVPVISVGEVGYGSLRIHDKTPRVGEDVLQRLPEYVLEEGDVVFARKGAVDRSAWVPPGEGNFFLGSDGIRVRFTDEVDSRYMAFQFRSSTIRDWLLQHAAGTTMASLNQPTLERIPLRIPPLVEQRGVAEVLGALDDKIAANAGLATAVDDLLGALFDRLSSTASWGCLEGIAHVNQASTKPQLGGTLRYLDIASVGTGTYELPEPIAWGEAPGRARRILGRGDTVWSTVRPNRRSHALVLDRSARLVASTGLAVLTPRSDDFAFVYEATRTKKFLAYLESAAEGSAYPAVRAERFLDAPVPRVVDADRLAFERVAAPLRERVHAATEESRTLTKLRDALLPQLMSGKIRVKDADSVVEGAV